MKADFVRAEERLMLLTCVDRTSYLLMQMLMFIMMTMVVAMMISNSLSINVDW